MNLREVGEFGLINRIAAQVQPRPDVILGIGDDAAALIPGPGQARLVTTDMLVEGIHFDLTLTDPESLGRKSLAVNLSDIAAMGGVPRHALLALAIPPSLTVEFIDLFMKGFLAKAAEFDVLLIGGDTCASMGGLAISVTVMGEQQPEKVVTRGGARPGDHIYVTGTLGDSALGLQLLRRGERQGEAVKRHLDPQPRVVEGGLLGARKLATAMIDVSDGLLADLGHILTCSSAGAVLHLEAIPQSPRLGALSESSDDMLSLALSGGEDYELLFTAPPSNAPHLRELFSAVNLALAEIGQITSSPGLTILSPDGSPYHPRHSGYDHFQ